MTYPDKITFLVIGAQKSGTSWLYHMLRQHPQVHTGASKELHFFNKYYDRGINWYLKQFTGHSGQSEIGEFTPNYLWVADSSIPARVYEHFPDIKLIVSLRDPVQRAISAYRMNILFRKLSPYKRLISVQKDSPIFQMGLYYDDLCKWLEYFPLNRFVILIFENDILKNRADTIRRINQHLNINENYLPDNLNSRAFPSPGDFFLHFNYYFPRLAPRFKRHFPFVYRITFPRIRVSQKEVEELAQFYYQSNQKLKILLNRSLPWTQPSQ